MKRLVSLSYSILRTTGVSFALVSMLLGSALVAYRPAEAATVTDLVDLVSESAPSSASNHSISFTIPTLVPASGKIVITFHPDFDTSAVGYDDVDLTIDGDQAIVTGAPGVTEWGFANASDVFTLTAGSSVSITAGQEIVIKIGKNTYVGSVGNNQITNPATSNTSYSIGLKTTTSANALIDDGTTFVAVVPTVSLTAEIAPTFYFIIDGMDTGSAIDSQVVSSASSATRANFGLLTPGAPVLMGTSLSLRSNAESVTVTVEQNHDMLASTGADIDSFANGADTYPAAAYTAPTGTLGNEATYGHLAITTEDSSTISKTSSVTSETNGHWIGLDVAAGPRTIWSVSGPADGTTQDIGHIDVGYRVEIAAAQEPGRYENRLMYIATPTFGSPAACVGSFSYCFQAPSTICRSGLAVALPASGATSVRNDDLLLSATSAAPVTGYGMYGYGDDILITGYDQAVALSFDCDQEGSTQIIDAYAYNKNGGGYCTTYALIQDNISTCDGSPAASGYPALWGIGGSSVQISNPSLTATLSYDSIVLRSAGLIDSYKTRIGGGSDVPGKIATYTCSDLGTQVTRFYGCNGASCNYISIAVDVQDNFAVCP